MPLGFDSARTFAIQEATQLQLNIAAVEKDHAAAETARDQAYATLRKHGVEPQKT